MENGIKDTMWPHRFAANVCPTTRQKLKIFTENHVPPWLFYFPTALRFTLQAISYRRITELSSLHSFSLLFLARRP